MKPVHEWNEDDVLNLPMGESQWLEVKGRRGLDLTVDGVKEKDVKYTLSVSLSALANSGGGFLIFGLTDPSRSAGGVWAVDDGGIAIFGVKGHTREWLDNLIPSLVDSRLNHFNVYAITSSSPTTQIQDGRALYVIEIPDSLDAPHQAQDNKYYIRSGSRSIPIGHRIVLDMMGRRRNPDIELVFKVEFKQISLIRGVKLIITAKNTGRVYAHYVNCLIYLPRTLAAHHITPFGRDIETIEGKDYYVLQKSNTRRDRLQANDSNYDQLGPSWFNPILPSLTHTWEWSLPSNFQQTRLQTDEKIFWKVYADNAPERSGNLALRDIPFSHRQETVQTLVKSGGRRMQIAVILLVVLVILLSWLAFRLFLGVSSLKITTLTSLLIQGYWQRPHRLGVFDCMVNSFNQLANGRL